VERAVDPLQKVIPSVCSRGISPTIHFLLPIPFSTEISLSTSPNLRPNAEKPQTLYLDDHVKSEEAPTSTADNVQEYIESLGREDDITPVATIDSLFYIKQEGMNLIIKPNECTQIKSMGKLTIAISKLGGTWNKQVAHGLLEKIEYR